MMCLWEAQDTAKQCRVLPEAAAGNTPLPINNFNCHGVLEYSCPFFPGLNLKIFKGYDLVKQ